MNERNLKQKDILDATEPLCKLYNVKFNKSDISQYIAGKSEPNQDKLYILSEALKVNVVWLMGFDSPMEQSFVSLKSEIEKEYGKTTSEMLSMYVDLDIEDKAEIKGEIKHMLKADKYSNKKESLNA